MALGMHKQVRAALELLSEPEISSVKLKSLRQLLNGVSPQTDTLLQICEQQLGMIEKVMQGDVVALTSDQLPESTEEERRHKAALVMFVKYWNQLKAEVERVHTELEGSEPGAWQRIFGGAKGPLAIVTLVAVGAVATFYYTSVTVAITNDGCSERIPTEITIPPVTVTVDARIAGELHLTAFGNTFSLDSAPDELVFNGEDLLGEKTDLDLGSAPAHILTVVCR